MIAQYVGSRINLSTTEIQEIQENKKESVRELVWLGGPSPDQMKYVETQGNSHHLFASVAFILNKSFKMRVLGTYR